MLAHAALGHHPFQQPDGTPILDLEDRYRGRKAALICGGPSFLQVDPAWIRRASLLTMTLNNGVTTFRSDLWLGVEAPRNFDVTIWKDPAITKFVPDWCATHRLAAGGANVVAYRRSDAWKNERVFAPESTLTWNNGRRSGGRTSMMDALRVLFVLGVRTIYLFGVDFHQSTTYGYHHDSPRSQRSIDGNNQIYQNLALRFDVLRPLMEAAGLQVLNCNPGSRLEAFPKGTFGPDGFVP